MSDLDEESTEEEQILSLCWDKEHLSAVHYNLSTLELNVRQT